MLPNRRIDLKLRIAHVSTYGGDPIARTDAVAIAKPDSAMAADCCDGCAAAAAGEAGVAALREGKTFPVSMMEKPAFHLHQEETSA